MSNSRSAKSCLCFVIILFLLFTLCACKKFKETAANTVRSPSGTEYAFLANEGFLSYLGELTYEGGIKGEDASKGAGLYALSDDPSDHILIRVSPDSEWYGIYRDSSLPPFDASTENCVRLEYLPGFEIDAVHAVCQDGITGKTQVADFFRDVCSQKNPREAGLYDLVKSPSGMLTNCYVCGVIYGFFAEESYLAIPMYVTSYDDKAYSVSIGNDEYVLPEKWAEALRIKTLN